MTEITYHYAAGADLSHSMKAQAHMLIAHATDLMNAGNSLVSENLIGEGGDAYLASLTRQVKAMTNIGETIVNHSGAVNNSFESAAATDHGAAGILSI